MAPLVGARLDSPLGALLAVVSERGLCGLPFLNPADEWHALGKFGLRLAKWFGTSDLVPQPDHPVILSTQRWLDAYFAGDLTGRRLPPLDMRGGEFERTVWAALLDIPAGTTESYGALARRLGSPGAARAVGLANGANPVPILVPCHRVIGTSGALTGYGGGLPRKSWLLDHERRHWGIARPLQFG